MLRVSKASAGSGKTFALALIYIDYMLRSQREEHIADPYRHILAVTFTKKATAEMKERIVRELYTLAHTPLLSPFLDYLTGVRSLEDEGRTERRQLTAAQRAQEAAQLSKDCKALLGNLLQDYPAFQVSTIDSFFQQVIRQFAAELGLTTHYNISLDDKQIIAEGIDQLFFDINDGQPELEPAFEELLNYAESIINDGGKWNPKEALRQFANELMHENVQRYQKELSDIANHPQLISNIADKLNQRRKEIEKDHRTPKGKPGTISKRAPQEVQKEYYTIVLVLEHLHDLTMLTAVENKIDERNRQEGRIPISETNMLLNRIIDGADTPFVYERLGTRLNHYLIDEFQDTSRLQWENFRPLIAESSGRGYENLVVGDVKQSIYRWRNSDMQILQDIDREGLTLGRPLPKTYNFRTAGIIVDANNLLFERYAQSLCTGERPKSPLVGKAYDGMRQEPVKKTLPGLYRIEWHDGDKATFISTALQRTVEVITSLKATSRISRLSEVAVLVRTNKEAAIVSEHLISQGIAVQSQEGLYIESHPAVKCLLALMRQTVNSDDKISAEIIKNIIPASVPFPASATDLFSFARNCIDTYHLNLLPDADAYLTAFLDVIYDYSVRNNTDISGFLDYWKSRNTPLCIPASQAPDAVQIMTVHKSKGLEFPVVILPFLTWSIGPDRKFSGHMLWCPTEGLPKPFSDIPLLPVKSKKLAAETYFAPYYHREEEMLYIDALNITYVAFTRAIHSLYAFAPQQPIERQGISVGCWLLPLLEDRQVPAHDGDYIYWQEQSDEGGNKGKEEKVEKVEKVEKEEPPYRDEATQRAVHYISVPDNGRMRMRTHAADYSEQTSLGTKMHNVLAHITYLDEADTDIDAMIAEGVLRQEEREEIKANLQRFFRLLRDSGHTDWFSNRYEIRTECDILTAEASVYRPDRLMIQGGHAVVLDYKFGKESAHYKRQVQHYMQLLQDMGYTTEGWLAYVKLDRLEHVDNL